MKLQKLGAGTWAILFLDACGKTHMAQSFKDLLSKTTETQNEMGVVLQLNQRYDKLLSVAI